MAVWTPWGWVRSVRHRYARLRRLKRQKSMADAELDRWFASPTGPRPGEGLKDYFARAAASSRAGNRTLLRWKKAHYAIPLWTDQPLYVLFNLFAGGWSPTKGKSVAQQLREKSKK